MGDFRTRGSSRRRARWERRRNRDKLPQMQNPYDRLIIALDTPEVAAATGWVERTGGRAGAYKLGLEFLHAAGPQGVRDVQAAGARKLFLDVKLSDIPNTVAGAVRSIGTLQPWMINVHAMCGAAAMRAARDAAEQQAEKLGVARPLVIAVTVLTSLDHSALEAIGVPSTPSDAVRRLAVLARESGMDGVVASPLEIGVIREACGPDFVIVTPGIRPAGVGLNDQARVATPAAAIQAGADYLVLGRAVTAADDPTAALDAIAAEVAAV